MMPRPAQVLAQRSASCYSRRRVPEAAMNTATARSTWIRIDAELEGETRTEGRFRLDGLAAEVAIDGVDVDADAEPG